MKVKKLTRAEEYRLKELDALQKTYEAEASLAIDKVHAEVADYRGRQMRAITDKVRPVEDEYRKACERTERERDKLIREIRKACDNAVSVARAHKREALASIEKEIDNLSAEVLQRVNAGIAAVDAALEDRIRSLIEERQAIRGEQKVQNLPDKPDVQAAGAEAPDRKPVGVQTV